MRSLLSKPPSEDPPPSPPYAGVRKRAHVQTACQACRKRKIKCDDRRPKCTPCALSNQECRFPVDGVATQRDDLVRELQTTTRKHTHLRAVIEALRRAEGEQLKEILQRIRSAGSVDDLLDMVGDASLLLQSANMGSRREGTSNKETSSGNPLDNATAPGSSSTDRSAQLEYQESWLDPQGLR
ncbi:hypothetical protein B0J15DRAFT_501652 [Fusarium solani]|uniref:Zn(2)-C6 fungal-type domain-containing protein n=1 Tax=Fusarium solani TaxID=169388 RepID=A0A9P9K7L4_FUSSL|nr:uncharacterized protein B0J15DRAFT_501652 [Fusarium solani]KAH7242954.1 hypothetical protein B0J15DRAFT_501652 [Fusarium solani]